MEAVKLSHLAETLIGSEIVKLGNSINERIRAGEKIFNYTIGDFNPTIFPIPVELENHIVNQYRQHQTNYPAADGVIELRQSLSAFLKDKLNLDYSTTEIQVASGGRPLIYAIFSTIVDKGDTIIYATPSWNNNHYTHLTGGKHCVIECTPENNFMPTAAQIEPHIEGATLICLCSPQNPTGTTLVKSELEKICDLIIAENDRRAASDKKLYLLFDQMYWTLCFGNIQHINPVTLRPEMRKYTLFVDGISKAFAATGVRVGWAFGPAYIIAKMKSVLSHLGAWAPMAEQKAVAAYLQDKEDVERYQHGFKAAIEERLQLLFKGFVGLKNKGHAVDVIPPQAAIYLTVKIDLKGRATIEGNSLQTQPEVTQFILEKAGLAIVPFSAFGAGADSPWYRISVGVIDTDDIRQVFENLEHAFNLLK